MSDDRPSDELLPCPFCGDVEASLSGDHQHGYCIVCGNVSCYAALGEGYDRDGIESHSFGNEGDAIEAWNRRVT